MKIGFIGLGKLGLPVALAIENQGHEVIGWDVSEVIRSNISARIMPYKELIAPAFLNESKIVLSQDFTDCEIVFMAIQTPHDPKYEGITRIPNERADFDYQYLKSAVKEFCEKQKTATTLVVISTVLPGTIERDIKPLLTNPLVTFAYNPLFIAMGNVVNDFLQPEFILLGVEDYKTEDKVIKFYETITSSPVITMPIRDAELTKVAYNTFIGMKIVFANTLMEICHKNGGNVDYVMMALHRANRRLISRAYLNAGMGDGGGCHPRDNIAMSHIARELNLSHNFFDDLMLAREHQTEWLANLIIEKQKEVNLPIVILGKSFKPETNIQTGSPAILLANILKEKGIDFIHIGEDEVVPSDKPYLYFIATNHSKYASCKSSREDFWKQGSVVFNPFGQMSDAQGIHIINIGRN